MTQKTCYIVIFFYSLCALVFDVSGASNAPINQPQAANQTPSQDASQMPPRVLPGQIQLPQIDETEIDQADIPVPKRGRLPNSPAPVPSPQVVTPVTQPSPVTPDPATPAPVQPVLASPASPASVAPVQPAPVTPDPVQPAPAQPAPSSPASVAPVQPAPVQPTPFQPTLAPKVQVPETQADPSPESSKVVQQVVQPVVQSQVATPVMQPSPAPKPEISTKDPTLTPPTSAPTEPVPASPTSPTSVAPVPASPVQVAPEQVSQDVKAAETSGPKDVSAINSTPAKDDPSSNQAKDPIKDPVKDQVKDLVQNPQNPENPEDKPEDKAQAQEQVKEQSKPEEKVEAPVSKPTDHVEKVSHKLNSHKRSDLKIAKPLTKQAQEQAKPNDANKVAPLNSAKSNPENTNTSNATTPNAKSEQDAQRDKFVQSEVTVLLLGGDDIGEGSSSSSPSSSSSSNPSSSVNNIDAFEYIDSFWQGYYRHKSDLQAPKIQKYIATVRRPPFYTKSYLSSSDAEDYGSDFAKKGDIQSLRGILDNTDHKLIYSDSGQILLQDAIAHNQYNVVYYLIMLGVRSDLVDSDFNNNFQDQSPSLMRLINKLN